MFATGFSMNVEEIAQNYKGTIIKALKKFSKKYAITIIAGYAEKRRDEKRYNTAVVYDKTGHQIKKYRKNHLFSLAWEDKYYLPGDGPVLFFLDKIPSSIFICYDLRFPEIFRKVAKTAHIIFVIANWQAKRQAQWESLLVARAIENQCFIIGVNRIGEDRDGQNFCGGSMVVDPKGECIKKGSSIEEYFVVDISPYGVITARDEFPSLKDIRYFIT